MDVVHTLLQVIFRRSRYDRNIHSIYVHTYMHNTVHQCTIIVGMYEPVHYICIIVHTCVYIIQTVQRSHIDVCFYVHWCTLLHINGCYSSWHLLWCPPVPRCSQWRQQWRRWPRLRPHRIATLAQPMTSSGHPSPLCLGSPIFCCTHSAGTRPSTPTSTHTGYSGKYHSTWVQTIYFSLDGPYHCSPDHG